MSAAQLLSDEQMEMRRGHIGGSEIAALLGEDEDGRPLHPFMGPIDVYLAKVEDYRKPVTPDMERGSFLEDGVARWYEHRTGTELHEVSTIRHPRRPRVGCTPDRLVNHADGATRLLSVKVPGDYRSDEWGQPHAWTVPTYAYLQLQYEMAIVEALGLAAIDYAHLAAPLGGDLQILEVRGDAMIQSRIMDEAEAWWARHVDIKTPPLLDGSESAKLWLRRRFPRDETRMTREATPAEDLLCMALRGAEKEFERAERAYDRARQPVEEAIGSGGGLHGPFGKLTFYADKRDRRTLRTTWK